ncbi:hypothetical protein [Streptomyces noursei]|uniref:hypothetical protein n=1 Tax=Streptomyces noursei TaxID=1971 RepID=UPI00167853DC|nr:hypothetical protein [Streptomyces noursei]MCZ1015212.1 hypothetical protein [Streptomyces noursei]GGX04048.1 hypothetical protein GCM10010341_27100 [Streptomyces noursei]
MEQQPPPDAGTAPRSPGTGAGGAARPVAPRPPDPDRVAKVALRVMVAVFAAALVAAVVVGVLVLRG